MIDALYAQLVQAAMDGCVAAGLTDRAPAVQLPVGWTLCGHLTALDHFALSDISVCYGFLAQRTETQEFAAVIRGTHGTLEWLEDAEFLPTKHPIAGNVEAGFWGVYQTLAYVPLGGEAATVAAALAGAVGNATLTVAGHSLGAAIATYLTFDMAWLLRDRCMGRFFASPRPGDSAFCRAFDQRVTDYQVYDYAPDIVPQIPEGPDYSYLTERTVFPKSARIRNSLDCFHTITTYEWLLGAQTPSACLKAA